MATKVSTEDWIEELKGISVIRMDGGRIAHENVYWDNSTMMAGAGMLG